MAITRVTAGSQASIDDLNQLIELLEGTSGYELAFLLRCLAGSDFKIRLSDASGTREFIIQDSAGVSVATIDSDGNMMINGSFTPGTIVLPTAASPSQTTEGSAVWDSDDDRLTVGTGAATKVIGLSRGAGSDASATQELMYDTTAGRLKVWDGAASSSAGLAPTFKYKTGTQVFTTDTAFADITASSGNLAFSVVANGVYRARGVLPITVGGTGGVKLQFTGPAAPTAVLATCSYVEAVTGALFSPAPVTAFSSSFLAKSSAGAGGDIIAGPVSFDLLVVNGANAGTVTLQGAQNSSNSTTTFGIGSYIEAVRVA